MKRSIAILMFAALTTMLPGCGYNEFEIAYPEQREPPVANISIASLQSVFYLGEPVTFDKDLVITGYVTTSDKAGNFYRSFFIDDGTGAVEILAGLYDLHSVYAYRQLVTVKLTGLTLYKTEGGLFQIGIASDKTKVTYIGHRVMLDKYIFRQEIFQEVKPLEVTPAQFNESLVGRVVRVRGLFFPSEYYWQTTWGMTTTLSTGSGSFVYINISDYASFTREKVPAGPISVTGILLRDMVYHGEYIYRIKMRDLDDVEIE